MKKLGFIGFGNMGKAIAFPIKEKFTIYIFDPFVKKSENYIFLDSLEALFEAVDTILLCVKPAQVPSVLHQLSRPMNIISIAAGVSIQSIRENSPEGSKIIRVMPNLAVQVAEGASAYYGEESLYPLVEEIFSSSGISLSLTSESLMDAVTGLSGSGPAFVFSFIHSLAEGGVKCGLTYPQALRLAIQTVKGSSILLEEELKNNPETHPYVLRNRVSSPGGTTIYGLSKLEKNAFSHAIIEAVEEASKRSKELGKS